MKEAINDFLAISEAGGLSPHTIKSRKTALHASGAWVPKSQPIAERDVIQVSPRHISNFLNYLCNREGLC